MECNQNLGHDHKALTPKEQGHSAIENGLEGGAHLGSQGQQLGNLGVSLVTGIDGQAFATKDDGMGVAVEGDHPIGDGVRGGQGQHRHEHDEQGSAGGNKVTHGNH